MNMLKVYHLPGRWGLVSVSPFCLKLDAFLRLSNIDHQSITTGTPFGSPKRKAPWIEHDGALISDSSLIIDYLKQTFKVDPSSHLSPAQIGVSLAIQRLIEDNLYWAMVHDRWIKPENWDILKSSVLGEIPQPMRSILAPIARRGVTKQVMGHGLGHHTNDEINQISKHNINALAAILGDTPYFFGDKPSEVDAIVYAQLVNIARVPFHSDMKAMIAAQDNLEPFIDRFQTDIYPD